jgi:hypothetical protein
MVHGIVRVECGYECFNLFINRFVENFPSLHYVSAGDLLLAFDGDKAALERINVALDRGDGISGNGAGWRGNVEVGDGMLRLTPYVGDRYLIIRKVEGKTQVEADFSERPSLHVAGNLAHGYGSSYHRFYTLNERGAEVLIEDVHEFIEAREAERVAELAFEEREDRANEAPRGSNQWISVDDWAKDNDDGRKYGYVDEDDNESGYLGAATLAKLRPGDLVFIDDDEDLD